MILCSSERASRKDKIGHSPLWSSIPSVLVQGPAIHFTGLEGGTKKRKTICL